MFIHAARKDSMNLVENIKSVLPTVAAVVAVGTFMAILGPFNSSDLGWPVVWIYWVSMMAVGWICGFIVGEGFRRFLPDLPRWLSYSLVSILVSFPITGVVAGFQVFSGAPLPLEALPILFFFVWVISAGVTTLNWLAERREDDSVAAGIGRALLDKLPHRLRRAQILALEAEDHYLRVHTDAGDALILIRLTDAIAAVDTLNGSRTHRSWWVSKDAVDTVARGDGRATLTLSNGISAPVSRTYAPKLRDAGWY
jgi:hypothetical protein